MTSRSRLLVGGLGAALAAAVVIAWVVRGGDGNRAPIDYSAVASVPAGITTGCPPPGRDLPYPADGVLPDGAVAVRLCNGPLLRSDDGELLYAGFDAPDDALTTGVADLADLANSLEPAATAGRLCTDDGGASYAYWFLYPGGDARAVMFNSGGCRDTTTAPGRVVEGGQALVAGFRRALLAQRQDQSPPGSDEVAGCNPNDAPVSPVATVGDVPLAGLTYCTLTLPHGTGYREGHLSDAQVAMVDRDIRAGGSPGSCTGRRFSLIRGVSAWGDRVVTSGNCHQYRLGRDTWTASPRVVRMLEGLALGPPERQCAALVGGHRDRGCPHW